MVTMLKKISLLLAAVTLAVLPVAAPLAAATPPTNLITNESMETAASETAPSNWSPSTWGTNTTVFSYENSAHTGTRSVKTTTNAYTDGDSKWYFTDVNVTAGQTYDYSNWYMSNVDTQIDAQVTATDGTITYHYVTTALASPSTWTKASAQFTMPANAKSVTFFQALNKVGYVQIDDASLSVFTPAAFTRGIVTLTFDDGWEDQYTNARPLLNQYGLPSTYYLLTSTVTENDYMTVAMMQTLGNEGNELASHTVTHPHLPQLNAANLTSELSQSQAQLRGWFGTGTDVADNFASPYGEYNATTISEIKKFYRSHRSTDEGFNSQGDFDIYNIKVQNILDDTTPAQVQAWVDKAIADKTWLVLVYHRVGFDSPTEEDYSVTTANLNTELAYIKNSGVAVKTVTQALNEITGQTVPTTPPATKPGDVNGDNLVDSLDLSLLLSNWNKTGATKAQGDLNADGTVDALDLSTLLTNWSK